VNGVPALAGAGVSEREAEVLALLGEHLSHAEIGARLFISVRTVESHVASLRRKLAADGRRELIEIAVIYRAEALERASALPARWPSPLTSFIGRVTEQAALAAALAGSRLVSAVGPGGVGKTRLALAVAAGAADRFPGGTWYVDLVPVTDPAMVPAAVLAAAGLGESSGRPAEDVLVAGVRDARALLVLDNCEHQVNGVAVLAERLLSACPNLVVLVTSRVRLVVPHEAVYVVGGLSVPAGGGGDEAGAGDAVALFAERAAAAGAPVLPGADRRAAAGICRALDGFPLAIELAAARLPSLGLDGLETGLSDQLSLLAGGPRQQQRHRSLHDTLDWSYQLLGAGEQAVLRRVAVFASPFGAAAAAAVAVFAPAGPARVPGALGRLAEHSLLVPVSGAGGTRYRMLEPVRQFGAALLGDDGHQARIRHLAWCLDTAAGLDQDGTAGSAAWAGGVDAASDDLRAALGWSAGQPGLRGDAHRLAFTLARVLFTAGRLREAQLRYEQAASLTGDQASAAVTLECAAAVAKCRVLGNEALRLDRAAAGAFARAGDPAAASVALARCAEHINRFSGMYADPPVPGSAETLLASARVYAGDDPRARAAIINAAANSGDPRDPASAELASRSLTLARHTGDPLLISAALDNAMLTQAMQGDIVEAAATAAGRIDALIPLARDPRAAFELKDALHTAIFTGVAAGEILPSCRHAEQGFDLPFVREERDLACEDLLAPAALAGQWDRVIALGEQFREGWEQAGRPTAPGRGIAPAAVAMVHGLRGNHTARLQWLTILAAIRGVGNDHAVHGSGFGEMFEAIVLLHHGQPEQALKLLTAGAAGQSTLFPRLCHQWTAALRAEAAVLSGHPGAPQHATHTAGQNQIATALTRRAAALLAGDRAALLTTAAAFGHAGYPYQRARTLILAGGDERPAGQDELTAMGATPMATHPRPAGPSEPAGGQVST
jgi:predicted ATPase/DNA-binding CsgD family transcriptional regulator